MYKQLIDVMTGQVSGSVLHIATNTYIPAEETNSDYLEYLKWLDGYEKSESGQWVKTSEGNTPEPADE